MYHNFADMLSIAEEQKTSLWRVILQNEIKHSDLNEKEIFENLEKHWQVMYRSAHKALDKPMETALNLISGVTADQNRYAEQKGGICGRMINKAMAYALSCSEVNASMGKICAAPTAGACGILPAVLITLKEELDLDDRTLLQGLLTASGVGAVFMKNATVAGAEGGCQAECGVAAAMAAAAAVELSGGTPRQALYAVCFTMMNCMGLVCDPVAGLVQVPCAQRNASQTVNALLSAELALGGMVSIITPDEIVESMFKVGKQLPSALRETAKGGIAATESGKKYSKLLADES